MLYPLNNVEVKMKLYIVHAGYYDDEIGIYELHTNFIVATNDISDLKRIVKSKEIFAKKRMHIDAVQEIEVVDGYRIILQKENCEDSKLVSYDYTQIKKIA